MLDHVSVAEVAHGYRESAPIPRRKLGAAPQAASTPASTVEALLFELRSGLSCLADPGACERLRCCDEIAMRTIAARLLSWKDKNKPWLPPWSEEDVAKLVDIRGVL